LKKIPRLKKINIAIDGYSSCGKSTLAKQLASHFGYVYIDSGAMYRAITLYAIQHGFIKDNFLMRDDLIKSLHDIDIQFHFNSATGRSETILNTKNVEKEIRGMEVSSHVSVVSLVKEVRRKLISLQQQLGDHKGVVMDGRDIGTAVFPDAELKIFMTADNDTRVKRRFDELRAKGVSVSLDEVQENIASRDHSDTTREENPLIKAIDAKIVDNTDLTPEEQFQLVKAWIEETIQVPARNI
jgi:cytidylate kinase